VEDSYAHDAQGYCAAIFGAGGVTTNSVVRRNVCVADGRSPRLARRQGDIYLSTWDKGRLKGVEVTDNRIFWDPPIAAPAIVNTAEIDGKPVIERNEIAPRLPPAAQPSQAHWKLHAYLSDDADSQVALVSSAYRQFHSVGLDVKIIVPRADPEGNRVWDWNLGAIAIEAGKSTHTPALVLEDSTGHVVWRHDGPVTPGDLGLALLAHLGRPDYAKLISEQ